MKYTVCLALLIAVYFISEVSSVKTEDVATVVKYVATICGSAVVGILVVLSIISLK